MTFTPSHEEFPTLIEVADQCLGGVFQHADQLTEELFKAMQRDHIDSKIGLNIEEVRKAGVLSLWMRSECPALRLCVDYIAYLSDVRLDAEKYLEDENTYLAWRGNLTLELVWEFTGKTKSEIQRMLGV